MYKETDQLYLKILIYLYNPSAEPLSENSYIKDQLETIKSLNEEDRMLHQSHCEIDFNLDNDLNRPVETLLISEKAACFGTY